MIRSNRKIDFDQFLSTRSQALKARNQVNFTITEAIILGSGAMMAQRAPQGSLGKLHFNAIIFVPRPIQGFLRPAGIGLGHVYHAEILDLSGFLADGDLGLHHFAMTRKNAFEFRGGGFRGKIGDNQCQHAISFIYILEQSSVRQKSEGLLPVSGRKTAQLSLSDTFSITDLLGDLNPPLHKSYICALPRISPPKMLD